MSSAFGSDSSEEEDALLSALLRIHRSKQRQLSKSDPAGAYGRILEHFTKRGERLRGEKLMTGELIERLLEGRKALPPRAVHQELELAATAGSTAAGRFRVTNRSATGARFELVVGDALDGGRRPTIAFEPAAGVLAAGESALVRVEARLTGWRAGESSTIPVECRWPSGRDRLWLVFAASPDPGSDR